MDPKNLLDFDEDFSRGFKILLFLMVFDGNLERMKRYYLEKADRKEFLYNSEFIVWLKNKIEENPDFLNQMRKKAEEAMKDPLIIEVMNELRSVMKESDEE